MDSCPPLPVELLDYIIDPLFDDKRTLCSSALVCRNWRVTSQFNLFRVICVKWPRTLEIFIDFLSSAPPHIAATIRDLSLCGSGASRDITYDTQLLVTTKSIAACMAHLPGLHPLSLKGVWWSDKTRTNAGDTPGALPSHPAHSLQKLHMCKVFTTPAVLFDTVCSFRALDTLHVESVFWTFRVDRGSDATLENPSSVRPSLRHLVLGQGSTYNMLHCLLPMLQDRMDIAELRSLSLSFEIEYFDIWRELRDFLECVSPHLQELSLKFNKHVTSSQSQLSDLQLSSFSALRSFQVDLPAEEASTPRPRCTWTLLQFLLLQLPPSVCDLIVVHRSHLEVLESRLADTEWAGVDALLTGSAFRKLKKVYIRSEAASIILSREAQSFYFFSSDDLWNYLERHDERTKLFLKEKLPQLNARGILLLE